MRRLKGRGLLVLAAVAALWHLAPATPAQDATTKGLYRPVVEYDPKRDAAADVEEAIAEARRTKRNVLLEVGGKWCIWCRIMDDYFEKNADVLKLREDNYVTVKINFSLENKNEALLGKYPEIEGYPHIFVLDAEGKLLHSQSTGGLESGKSYDRAKMVAFLEKWAPAK
jgi:thiol:disulfide interchange protein